MKTENCNFTEFAVLSAAEHLYYGRASIKKDFYIANYNEDFFNFIGSGGYFPLCDLIHPDDSGDFYHALENLAVCPQHLLLRIKCNDYDYRLFYTVLTSNGRIIDGFESFDIEVSELLTVMDKFRDYDAQIDEYEGLLSLFDGGFFEYSFGSDRLSIFKYEAGNQALIYENTMTATQNAVMGNTSLTLGQKSEFEDFYNAIKSGRDYRKLELDKKIFVASDENTRYECRFRTTYLDGIKDHVVGVIHVTNAAKSDKHYYETEAAYDPGTGILNKRAIHEYASDMIRRGDNGTYLAIVDIDNFKSVNDNYGHLFGDEVLLKIAEILKEVTEGHGTPGRFGGDEFMLLLQGIRSDEELHRILSTIMSKMQWAYGNIPNFALTASIGISKFPEDGLTYDDLFHKADKCVYVAKAKGKNRYIIYDEAKYGAVVKEESFKSNVGIKSIVSEEKKSAEISNLILALMSDGSAAFPHVIEQMQAYFDIDGVALYSGSDLKRILSSGKYINPIQNLTCIQEEGYYKYFDDYGWCQVSRMQKLETAPEAFRLYTEQENGKFIQCKKEIDGRTVAVISFDFFNRAPKFSESDLSLIKIVGRAIVSIAAKESKP